MTVIGAFGATIIIEVHELLPAAVGEAPYVGYRVVEPTAAPVALELGGRDAGGGLGQTGAALLLLHKEGVGGVVEVLRKACGKMLLLLMFKSRFRREVAASTACHSVDAIHKYLMFSRGLLREVVYV
jgi:hypothetical protein